MGTNATLARDRGLTLVEMLLALAILGAVCSVGYLFISSGSGLLLRGAASYRLQRETALAAELITQEVRNAVALELLDAPPVHPEGGWRYIYRDSAARAVVRVDETGQAVRRGGDLIEALTFRVLRTNNNNVLRFRVGAAVGGQRYELFSGVLLNNLLGKDPSEEKQVVRYKLPP